MLPGKGVAAWSGGVRSSPAWFNGNIYYGDSGGTLKAFSVTDAKLSTTPTSQSATAFVYPGASPVVSANGTSNAIVWAHENTHPAVLHAYDASNLAHELYNSNQATGARDQFGAGNEFIAQRLAVAECSSGRPTHWPSSGCSNNPGVTCGAESHAHRVHGCSSSNSSTTSVPDLWLLEDCQTFTDATVMGMPTPVPSIRTRRWLSRMPNCPRLLETTSRPRYHLSLGVAKPTGSVPSSRLALRQPREPALLRRQTPADCGSLLGPLVCQKHIRIPAPFL